MKLLVLIAVSVLAYAGVAWSMQYLLRVEPSSTWYWVAFAASFAVLGVGLVKDFRAHKQSLSRRAVVTGAAITLTAVADLAVAVAHSCYEGVCI